MANEVRLGRRFQREARRLLKKYASLRRELGELQTQLRENPRFGSPLGSSLYKIRLAVASKGQGKSGGMRIITYVVVRVMPDAVVYLVRIYDKSEQENLPNTELREIIRELTDDEADPA